MKYNEKNKKNSIMTEFIAAERKYFKLYNYLMFITIATSIIAYIILIFFTINTTGSLPKGIYINVFKEPEINDIVLFCPPQNNEVVKYGYEHHFFKSSIICPGNFQPLMKRVYAVENDIVEVTNQSVIINNKVINNTAYINFLPVDLRKKFVGKLNKDEYFLLSNYHKNSFDSRYFGQIHKDSILKTLKPLILWR